MKELLLHLHHKPWTSIRGAALVDTCFLIDELRHHRDPELLDKRLAMLSFNAEELVGVAHHLPGDVKKQIRDFLKASKIPIVDVPVSPGDWSGEEAFVSHVDPDLLRMVRDPSDAVLVAAAIATRSAILTKDKHHIFTVILENYLDHGVEVFKEMKDFERSLE